MKQKNKEFLLIVSLPIWTILVMFVLMGAYHGNL